MNRWVDALLIFVGVGLLVLMVWFDWRDGTPTMSKGDQPFEVVLTGGLGLAALGSGVRNVWRGVRRKRSDRENRR